MGPTRIQGGLQSQKPLGGSLGHSRGEKPVKAQGHTVGQPGQIPEQRPSQGSGTQCTGGRTETLHREGGIEPSRATGNRWDG